MTTDEKSADSALSADGTYAEWLIRLDALRAAIANPEAERAERARRADCFDDLLGALEIMTYFAKLKCGPREAGIWAEHLGRAEAAIAKAKGEPS